MANHASSGIFSGDHSPVCAQGEFKPANSRRASKEGAIFLALQRLAGNHAVAAVFQGSQRSLVGLEGVGTLQRMVAFLGQDGSPPDRTEWITINHFLGRSSGPLVPFRTADFSEAKPADSVTIAGHGLAGQIGGLRSSDIWDRFLTPAKATGIKAAFGELVFANCYSDVKPDPDNETVPSVREFIEGQLHKRNINMPVYGAGGPLLVVPSRRRRPAFADEGPRIWVKNPDVKDRTVVLTFVAARILLPLINGMLPEPEVAGVDLTKFEEATAARIAEKAGIWPIFTRDALVAPGASPHLALLELKLQKLAGQARLTGSSPQLSLTTDIQVKRVWEELRGKPLFGTFPDHVDALLSAVTQVRMFSTLALNKGGIPARGEAEYWD